jgi:hypothetical protein
MAENRPSNQPPGDTRRLLLAAVIGGIVVLLLLVCTGIGWLLGSGALRQGNATSTPGSVQPPPETDAATEGVSTEVSTEEVGDGACDDICNPDSPNCLAGLSCLPSVNDPSKYMCWNDSICTGGLQPAECEAGWLPAGGCVCCGSTLVCSDGTVAAFNPQCTGGYP